MASNFILLNSELNNYRLRRLSHLVWNSKIVHPLCVVGSQFEADHRKLNSVNYNEFTMQLHFIFSANSTHVLSNIKKKYVLKCSEQIGLLLLMLQFLSVYVCGHRAGWFWPPARLRCPTICYCAHGFTFYPCPPEPYRYKDLGGPRK